MSTVVGILAVLFVNYTNGSGALTLMPSVEKCQAAQMIVQDRADVLMVKCYPVQLPEPGMREDLLSVIAAATESDE